MITHLESDILVCEIKWALGSITVNKASGDDGIPAELFQILKDDAVKVLHSLCQKIWKTRQWPQDWKRSVFIPIPKKGNAKECSDYHPIALISHANEVKLKILQARLQQYVNCELPDVQAGFRKGRGTRDQEIAKIIDKAREIQKKPVSLTAPKPLTVWITTNCGKFLKRWKYQTALPEKSICRSRSNSYNRTWNQQQTGFQIGKGVRQVCMLSPCLFNLYAEYIMQNARLGEAQAGIKIAKRSINNLRHADDTILMAESKEELKRLLMN